jgi:cytochrome oxidase Cu insertion factor (SCO1/SenC/PrrC family)
MKKKWLSLGLSLAVIALAGAVLWQMMPERAGQDARLTRGGGQNTAESTQALIGGAFTLQNMDGQQITERDLQGKYTLVYFGFTYCPDICPTTLLNISNALNRLGRLGEKVRPVFITLDPERDSTEVLKLYASNFHPSLLVLRGSPEQVKQAAEAYKVYYTKNMQENGEYLVDHTGYAYLMDEKGNYLTHFTHEDNADTIMAILTKYIR